MSESLDDIEDFLNDALTGTKQSSCLHTSEMMRAHEPQTTGRTVSNPGGRAAESTGIWKHGDVNLLAEETELAWYQGLQGWECGDVAALPVTGQLLRVPGLDGDHVEVRSTQRDEDFLYEILQNGRVVRGFLWKKLPDGRRRLFSELSGSGNEAFDFVHQVWSCRSGAPAVWRRGSPLSIGLGKELKSFSKWQRTLLKHIRWKPLYNLFYSGRSEYIVDKILIDGGERGYIAYIDTDNMESSAVFEKRYLIRKQRRTPLQVALLPPRLPFQTILTASTFHAALPWLKALTNVFGEIDSVAIRQYRTKIDKRRYFQPHLQVHYARGDMIEIS